MVTAMEQIDLVSLFLLGLLGTGHCVGMCGPLVFAFPGQTGRFVSHLAYHGGRLGTYAMIGVVMGGLGAGLALVFAGAESTAYLKVLGWIQEYGLEDMGLASPAYYEVRVQLFPRLQAAMLGEKTAEEALAEYEAASNEVLSRANQ